MGTPHDAKTKSAFAYNSAADYYDHSANFFWVRFGRRTVERLQLPSGARVLDVCCGSGASAIPASEAVGLDGSVLGVDLAENLLALARSKANQLGLKNIEFRTGDMLELDLPDASFDAVICVFGIFFVPDMKSGLRALWRMVRPGGKLAVTTWGPRFFEPVNTAFWNSIRAVKPELYKGFNPWERITEPNAVRSLFEEAGVAPPEVVAEQGSCQLTAPEDWWVMVLGSGYRGTIEQLNVNDRERVRLENLDFIRSNNVRSVEANVVYAVSVRNQLASK